ncbi:class I SAM-dependent methyltransferase [Rhizobium sp. 57MFTsu3.2]|uniref:class I SAM-dependent methyltransferase n=1 Tax=Rhizobium sp. 57MFTsu3.2 TaxID=1048681 RepID=UPI00146ED26B|nr:class I SAM-dependent methyltransferase [Rhizobium sp. 57MFTsu3.2]NMN73795.1 Methylase involved in ubiquinone/menaquinone biosynthesis [Rhizobium sp. 57MFTsu3.2]
MKQCIACGDKYHVSGRTCPSCGVSPAVVGGFDAYAPDFAYDGGGFSASYFSELARLEETNFWFRARNKIILWALERYVPNCKSLLEIGCGTGFVLTGIASKFPSIELTGSEIFAEGLEFASKRLPSADLMQMDAQRIPFVDEFDVVGAFDVLEHIKEDKIVLGQIHKALKPNGVVLLTVPQHQWLWSTVDEYAFHERRYSAFEIEEKVRDANFQIIRSSSFVTALLPAMAISRVFQKHIAKEFDPAGELKINHSVNFLLEKMMMIELAGLKIGMNYPLGGSRLVIARKS